MKLKSFVLNPFYENTYLIWDENSNEGLIIDPGCSDANEEKIISDFLLENKINLKFIFNTHAHIDHVLGNAFLIEKYNAELWGGEKDNFILEQLPEIGRQYGIGVKKSPLPTKYFQENAPFMLGDITMEFLFTPGHSPGEYCIYLPDHNICFSGDVLFYEGIGRTDLWGGDFNTLINSITGKLFSLPEITVLYPGHGESTTVNHEKGNNPYI